jgi:L-threonylcarbamoyladenylate synthase
LKERLKNSKDSVSPVVSVDPSSPSPVDIGRAADILNKKGVVAFPTTGLYGLGADARCADAVRRVFAIKRRPALKPVLVLLSGIEELETLVQTIPAYAQPFLGLWPGGITLIFECRDTVVPELTGGTGKIGVRFPAHPVAKALVARFKGPITGTSANLAGMPAVNRVADLDEEIRSRVDLVLDAGPLAGGAGSTVLDVSAWPVKLLREGAVPRSVINDILKHA